MEKIDHSDAVVYISFVFATIRWCERDVDDPKNSIQGKCNLPYGLEEWSSARDDVKTGQPVLQPRRKYCGAALES